jgi:superoxide dismutase, Fe-Mn family
MKRREMLQSARGLMVAGFVGGCFMNQASPVQDRFLSLYQSSSWDRYPFIIPDLSYSYNSLEPVVSSETMQLHHDVHHGGYAKKATEALTQFPELQKRGISALLADLSSLPEEICDSVRNFGGGHFNHSLFWESLQPSNAGGGKPGVYTLPALLRSFGTISEFRNAFEMAGVGLFGSGWVWLVSTDEGVLSIRTTANQDTPLADGYIPLLGNDVWEHAYYLTYRSKRADYLSAWWSVVNWSIVERRYVQIRNAIGSLGTEK